MKLKMRYLHTAGAGLVGCISLLAAAQSNPPQSTTPQSKPSQSSPAPQAAGRGHQAPASRQRKGSQKTATPVSTPQAPAPEPQVAQQPLRPSQMPAVPPRISYADGKLTVIAENSTLGDVLNSIHNATGMQIESSGGSANERVAAKIGPASVRQVLLAVLEGSHYDYILLGSETNPDNIDKVILTPKSGGVGAPGTAVGSAQAPAADDSGDDDNAQGFANPAPSETTTQVPAPGTVPGQVKTPEQLLQDLRRMEQQRRAENPGAQGVDSRDVPPRPTDRPPDE